MKKIILIIFLFLTFSINAQIGFLNNNIIDSQYCIDSVTNVITLDIDNDGDLDVISSSNTQYIVWQENLDGQGTFGNIHLITDQLDGIKSITIADIDNDSDMDIISSSSTDGIIAWHENLGQGNFTMHVLGSEYNGAQFAKAADIDGDGFLDIIANTSYGKIGWFRNTNGLGNFSSQNTIATGLSVVSSIDVKDADGDGDNDVVATSSLLDNFMKVGLLINTNGLGTFGTFQLLKNETPETNYSIVTKVLFQDLDNDGDNDILFSANNKLFSLINSGTGVFPAINTISNGYIRDRIMEINLKDMDNDGDIDVVIISRIWQNTDKVIWYDNNSTHTYTSSTIILNSTDDQMMSFKIDDIDGDNSNDIVTGNYWNNNLVWFKNYTTIKPIAKYCYYPDKVKAADLDNDGDLDIISTIGNTKLVWYENLDGAGTTGIQKIISFGDVLYSYDMKDIDGDGDIDIATDGKWFKNDGFGNFSRHTYVDGYPSNSSFNYIEDVDNDGKNDFIAVDNLSNGNSVIGWYKNLDGLGNFGPRQNIMSFSGFTITKIVFTDIDDDGDKDIVFSGGKIGIIKNLNGLGNFATTYQSVYNYGCGEIYCVDMDGDGDKDILTTNVYVYSSEIGVGWFKNTDGLGNFNSSVQLVGNSAIEGAFPADMDNDGDLDVVSNQHYGTNTVWLENLTGLGVFSQPRTLIVNEQRNTSNTVADIDNDGKLDVIYSSNTGNYAATWFKNNGLLLNKISGTVRLDLNNNGCDATDNPMQNIKIVTSTSTNNTYATFTSSNGYYQFYLANPGNYATTVASTLPSYFNFSPSSYNNNFTGINGIQTLNFCISPNQTVNDLDVAIYPFIEARPGFTSGYTIVYHNKGTTQQSGNVKLQYDASKQSFSSAVPAVSSQTASELIFNFTNVKPFETRIIKVYFQTFTLPSINLGDILNFTVTVDPINNDATPTDNIAHLNQTVIGAYDPNDINVLEGQNIYIDEINNYLHYIIRFQNTGSASAINVVVTNNLDNNLDWDSLDIEGISHNNYVSIRNGNQISFVFNGIYLPSVNNNELGSHGFICYRIKPKNNSVVGDIFKNNAQIYFDFNPAIHTNTVQTQIINPLTNSDFDFESNKIALYPNPTNGIIYISANFEIKKVEVYNVVGQKITETQINNKIDITGYNVGVYYIKIEDTSGKSIIKKIIKK